MDTIDYNLKIKKELYPILFTIKEEDFEKTILNIFDIGFNCLYPNNNDLKENINNKQLENKFEIKLELLESTINKLIGLQTNSSRKGKIGELLIDKIIKERYGDIDYTDMSETNHCGDAWIKFDSHDTNIMLEIKNYTLKVNKDEIIKMKNDMKTNNINWGIFISINSGINNYREFDIDTFNHHGNKFTIIMISNLSNDISRIDMGIQIIRKLINNYSNTKQFPWITNKIKSDLDKLNQIIKINYQLRDHFFDMEKNVTESLYKYYNNLRDYQLDIDNMIKDITNNINGTMNNSINEYNYDYNDLILKYKENKKIYPILLKLVDKFQKNNIYIKDNILMNDENNIGTLKIQQKKILIVGSNFTLEFNHDDIEKCFKLFDTFTLNYLSLHK